MKMSNKSDVIAEIEQRIPIALDIQIYNAIDAIKPVGSRVTCNPPPKDTDIDYLVLFRKNYEYGAKLRNLSWSYDGSEINDIINNIPEEDRFQSYSCGDVNFICTTSENFYLRFIAATKIAKSLNLMEKEDRIVLFQAILYENYQCDIDALNVAIEEYQP